MRDTGDLVQDAIIGALRKLDSLEIRTEGALIAYLRTSLQHAIIDELRRRGRRPAAVEIPEDAEAEATSPIDAAIGAELMEKSERALVTLSDEDRQAIILRVELGYDYDEIAIQMQKPSKAAARMAVSPRSQLAEAMGCCAA